MIERTRAAPARATGAELEPFHSRRWICVIAALLPLAFCAHIGAQETSSSDPRIRRAPEPFSLDAYSAVQAVWMLRRARFLGRKLESGALETVVVESVRVVAVERDPHPVPVNESRYDLVLNGSPIDWEDLYIPYDGRMTNLRMLFTYRNQRPVPGDPFLLRN